MVIRKLIFAAVAATFMVAGAASADEVASYKIVDGTIPDSLTGAPGDAKKGKDVFLNRRLGNCLACHQVTALSDHPFHGEIGPPLDGVAERYTLAELRLQVVDSKEINPDTIMPAFYRNDGFHKVLKNFKGKSVLTAEQVEDVLAYLMTLN